MTRRPSSLAAAGLALAVLLSACTRPAAGNAAPTATTAATTEAPKAPPRLSGSFYAEDADGTSRLFTIRPTEDGYLGMFVHHLTDEDGIRQESRGAVMTGRECADGAIAMEAGQEFFRITTLSEDAILLEGTDAGGESPFSGRYVRMDGEKFQYTLSVPENDVYLQVDEHCAVRMDTALAAGIRAQLGLADDAYLDEEQLGRVTELSLTDSSAVSLVGIDSLPRLQKLQIEDACLGALPDLSACTALRELRLRRNLITDLSPLNSAPRLQTVDVADNRVTSLAPLAGNTQLLFLRLDGNCILDYAAVAGNAALRAAIDKGCDFTFEEALEAEELAVQTVASLTAGLSDPLQKEAAIYRFMIDNTEYSKIDYHEYAFGAAALKTHYGICRNYAETFALLCNHAGIETFVCDNADHAWNIVKIGGRYYHADSLWDENHPEWIYFNRGSWYISTRASHDYDTRRIPTGLLDMDPLEAYAAQHNIFLQGENI